ncbi:methionine ABC transporter ATP-binding protein [Acholeplasma laidlawii]|uniref:methionine ABC transporter ATP-binding protein n=1 Tax=Acholeplasma laidlawii TaxID=2148 RepID=UPI0021F7AE83|nr:ATP-binding cassette domain-containing protein [Acholeplasma laidlawii]
MIHLNHVTHTFEDKNHTFTALNDINLHISKGEVVGIVGYSGAGKSTLIRLLNGLITPTSGDILIEGKHINQLAKKDLNRMRHKVAMIFQSFNLLASLTVYENIALALTIANYSKRDIKNRVLEVLELVGLTDKKNEYPKTLSGGQKQRVGIARAIANHPDILLCDEITSALDQKTTYEIIEVLKSIQEKMGVTICFISHQLDVVRQLCDRIVVIDQGRIVEDKNTKDIFISPEHSVTRSLIDSLFETHLRQTEHVYKLIYTSKVVDKTILSDVIKKYDIHTNIIHAKSIELKDEIFGYLWIEITGKNRQAAIQALKTKGIEVQHEFI